jgi:hypothetical protein
MRAWIWITTAALAATVLAVPSAAMAAEPATATPAPVVQQASPTVATAKAAATPTSVPPTPVPTTPPSTSPATAAPQATPAPPKPTGAATAIATVVPTVVATAPPAPTRALAGEKTATPIAPALSPPTVVPSAIHGVAFFDADANGEQADSEPGLGQLDVTLSFANGLSRTTRTADNGTFTFDGLAPGAYRVTVGVPIDYVTTTDAGQDIDVQPSVDAHRVLFGLISAQAAGLKPDSAAVMPMDGEDEQIIALASVTSLPLRFAEGRDLMAQVQRRVLGDGLMWLGVPFRSQIDGGNFQYVNCGPASLTMVLAGFGLEVGPSQVRDYLNNLIDNFDTDLGTSLDVLSRIGREAGLTPMDLYSDRGGYRNWSTDAVRWHLQQAHPVITLVKYRNLPGHRRSISDFDHYIVVSGLTPNGFIYNDAAFATTLGYGLEISDLELEFAWENSSIPHHALALGLSPDKRALSFPELPRKPRLVAADGTTAARGIRRLAAADEAPRAPLTLTPMVPLPSAASGGPLVSERWQNDPDFLPVDQAGTPMGLNIEQSELATLEPRPGPGTIVPKLLTLLGGVWLVWVVWALSGRLVRYTLNRTWSATR